MGTEKYVAYISNGKAYSAACANTVIELEEHDQVIQSDECCCTRKEHELQCELQDVIIEVKEERKIKKYIVEMAFCKECGAYYMPQKSYEYLSQKGTILHSVKGGVILFKYMTSGEPYREEDHALKIIEGDLTEEYNNLPKTVSRYAVDDGCGGLYDLQGKKYDSKSIYAKQDEIYAFSTRPYIGRLDVGETEGKHKIYYIGGAMDRQIGKTYVRARWSDVGRLYGSHNKGEGNINGVLRKVELRREIDIVNGVLLGVMDTFSSKSIYAEKGIYDPFLINVLMTRKKSHQLTDIISTIQEKQNEIIEKAYAANIIIQGCAGSGKTMVMLHRLSYWLYNNHSLKPNRIKILTPNENFNVHITGLKSTLNLSEIEIMSVDQYYAYLLDKYDPKFSYHETIEEEENIPARYLNYIYSKSFFKQVKKMYSKVLEGYFLQEEVEILKQYVEEEKMSFRYQDDWTAAEKGKVISRYVGVLYAKLEKDLEDNKRIKKKISDLKHNKTYLEEHEKNLKKTLDIIEKQKTSDGQKKYNKVRKELLNIPKKKQMVEKDILEQENKIKEVYDYQKQKRIYDLLEKYSSNFTNNVFEKIFDLCIEDKLKELNIKKPNGMYRCVLYARIIFAELFWNRVVGQDEIICIDEGQDVSFSEYERIIYQNQNHSTFYNIYGDLNQRIKLGRGLRTWEQLAIKLTAHVYELNENYRNTNQVTQYCNEEFGFDMTLTGVEGENVKQIAFSEMLKEIVSSPKTSERKVVILPRSILKTSVINDKRISTYKNMFSLDFDTSKISIMYVDEIKGIEFDTVYVIDEGMERNERYIAYTRALDNLIIVHIDR